MEISKNTVIYPGLKIGCAGVVVAIFTLFSYFGDYGTGFFMATFCLILAVALGSIFAIVGQFLRVIIDPFIPDFILTTFWGAIGYKLLFRFGFPIIGGMIGGMIPLALIDPSMIG